MMNKRASAEAIFRSPMLKIGDRGSVKSGPMRKKSFIVLGVSTYSNRKDDAQQARAEDSQAKKAKIDPHYAMGFIIPDESGRKYKVRFNDGKIATILDVEL